MPMTAQATAYATALESIITAMKADIGLTSKVSATQLAAGIAASRNLNNILATIIDANGYNADKVITPEEMMAISDKVRADPALYLEFSKNHGDDEGSGESGFHLLKDDGGILTFQGRSMINTVIDAIYHYGYEYYDGRFVNEDGNPNEEASDIAGWLNFFLNGQSHVFGTAGDDELGSSNYSSVVAAAADEIFDAGDGDDSIWAGTGNDTVNAGAGDDRSGGGIGNDTMYGGGGTDQLWGDAGNDKIYGENDDDSLGGGSGADVVVGGAGNDQISGDDGNDCLKGGIGDDRLNGGMGADKMYGDDGDDSLWGDSGDDTIDGGAGNDSAGGGYGNDSVTGGDGDDDLDGNEGNDRIEGNAGNDIMDGGSGNDILLGGSGNDILNGSEGVDVLKGGSGADTFRLWDNDSSRDVIVIEAGDSGRTRATIDTVEGFAVGEDVVDLRAFPGMTFEDLDYAGGHPSAYYDGRYLRIDTDGDRASDMIVQFKWIDALSASDFLFA